MLNSLLTPPSVYYPEPKAQFDLKVKDWIHQYTCTKNELLGEEWQAILFGVPLSRSSISVSGASEFPEHFRRYWNQFSIYNIDYEMDLSELRILDIGDVKMHHTDIAQSHSNIRNVMQQVLTIFNGALPIAIGGDHSITAMLVKGIKEIHPKKRIGIVQFDTHLDLRDLTEHGPTNGTPIRNLIESSVIKGHDVYNIGLHGFFNAPSLITYAKEKGVNYTTLKEARKKGITQTVSAAVRELESKVDGIYVTIDMDVLDIGFAPGVPASTPGGMRTDELFEAVFTAAQSKKLVGMDIVCLDPTRDTAASPTVKAGVYTFLTFITGLLQNK
ncbi:MULTISPECIES: agmatinase family protein [unclassified Bacillus (in: firmicutes)]|uniref:agmatinase family protein n=1 Tax=unclassified Bacillus (in: firmicutes) TaxID=185979 RepID=UPI0008E9576D|nr:MULTISPECIES: agmatinase family protein [unclassified Bacillus (in: firmicutes)]SFA91378.1 formiminoglutamase [Bacillus sp. UNCCL13]SFQ85564.1 formiminoglutamase [Bacillus sp. cl95]